MFERVSVPTPFQVGPVNAYLAGRTVVDPGPDSERAWATLVEALSARNLAPEDVKQVVVTHPHPDHFGLAARLRQAGARVVASAEAASVLSDFPARLDYEQQYFRAFFVRCGMAEDTAATVTDLPEAFVHYAPSVTVDHTVSDGDTVAVDDRRLDVVSLAGHAVGELGFAFEAEGERVAVVGDQVLADITPNPFLQPPPESGGDRPRVLPTFNDSLARLREAGYDRLLPGHREPIADPTARIDETLAAHEERTEAVAALVDGPTTPVDVMEGLFEDLAVTEQFSGMSEAVGHLDVLEAEGRVTVRQDGGLRLYEPAAE
jgi:glyoxylase-like metal-dependent hydrolase (beta-lactamase superfamily II)